MAVKEVKGSGAYAEEVGPRSVTFVSIFLWRLVDYRILLFRVDMVLLQLVAGSGALYVISLCFVP